MSHVVTINNHQPSTINHQPSTINLTIAIVILITVIFSDGDYDNLDYSVAANSCERLKPWLRWTSSITSGKQLAFHQFLDTLINLQVFQVHGVLGLTAR